MVNLIYFSFLRHEQSRTDRDQYIQILWNNVPAAFKSAFEKYGRDKIDSLGQYDICFVVLIAEA